MPPTPRPRSVINLTSPIEDLSHSRARRRRSLCSVNLATFAEHARPASALETTRPLQHQGVEHLIDDVGQAEEEEEELHAPDLARCSTGTAPPPTSQPSTDRMADPVEHSSSAENSSSMHCHPEDILNSHHLKPLVNLLSCMQTTSHAQSHELLVSLVEKLRLDLVKDVATIDEHKQRCLNTISDADRDLLARMADNRQEAMEREQRLIELRDNVSGKKQLSLMEEPLTKLVSQAIRQLDEFNQQWNE